MRVAKTMLKILLKVGKREESISAGEGGGVACARGTAGNVYSLQRKKGASASRVMLATLLALSRKGRRHPWGHSYKEGTSFKKSMEKKNRKTWGSGNWSWPKIYRERGGIALKERM